MQKKSPDTIKPNFDPMGIVPIDKSGAVIANGSGKTRVFVPFEIDPAERTRRAQSHLGSGRLSL